MLTPARAMIKDLFDECAERQGWQVPDDIKSYCVAILTDHINRPDWQPQPSYAEQFMNLRTTRAAIELGNECWFTRAVFPELMERRGIRASYYVDMGMACYERALTKIENPTLAKIVEHFEFTAEIAWTAIHSRGSFREMWD